MARRRASKADNGVLNAPVWKNILFKNPGDYTQRMLCAIGTDKNVHIKSNEGLMLFVGRELRSRKFVPYGVRYDAKKWKQSDVLKWWSDNKRHCTWFK